MPPYFQASLLRHFSISKVRTKDDPNVLKKASKSKLTCGYLVLEASPWPFRLSTSYDGMESTTSFSELSKAATGVGASILRIYLRDVAWTVGIYLAIPLSTRLESFEARTWARWSWWSNVYIPFSYSMSLPTSISSFRYCEEMDTARKQKWTIFCNRRLWCCFAGFTSGGCS